MIAYKAVIRSGVELPSLIMSREGRVSIWRRRFVFGSWRRMDPMTWAWCLGKIDSGRMEEDEGRL